MKKVLLIVLALGLFSCSKENEIDSVINADYYEVNKNDTFDVSLYSIPGFYWRWVETPKDASIELINTTFNISDNSNSALKMYGTGGYDVWNFKGKESGIYTLTFESYHPWDPNLTLETKNITVKIN